MAAVYSLLSFTLLPNSLTWVEKPKISLIRKKGKERKEKRNKKERRKRTGCGKVFVFNVSSQRSFSAWDGEKRTRVLVWGVRDLSLLLVHELG